MSKTTKSSITNKIDRKGGLNPDVVDVTIVPGDNITVDITATVPKNTSKGLPLDLVFLTDLSGSFSDDLPVLRDLVPRLVSSVRDIQPDSQFGLASFIDKPIGALGGFRDYVYQTEQEITKSRADFQKAMDGLKIGSGSDFPEAQLEGLMQVALREKEIGYRKNSRRVVVISTDADYHQAGDGKKAGIRTPNNGDIVLDGRGTGEDYPSIAQVRDALQEAGIVPIFAVTKNQARTYEKLVDKLGVGVVERLSRDSSNLVKVVTDGLEDIFNDLTMVPQSDDFSYVQSIKPATHKNVPGGASRTFKVELGTKNASAGKDRLSLEVLGYGETVVNVTPVGNAEPVAKNDRLATDVGRRLVIKPEDLLANDSDEDGDKLSISKVGKATNGTVQLARNGRITFTPKRGFTGSASFEYTVDDGNKGTDSATVTVQVKKANSAPTAKNDKAAAFYNRDRIIESKDLLANDSDKDGDKLTISRVGNASKGKVKLARNGDITFTPNKNFTGKASFDYTTSDGKGGRDSATVNVTVIGGDKLRGDRSARFAKADALTGGEESDRFLYDDLLDGGRIASFDVGNDVIVLTEVLDGAGYEGSNAIADEYVRVVSRGAGAMVQIDPDGPDGPESFQPFVSVKGIAAETLNDPSNFAF